ncbi:hypothetical protein VPH35_087046 [Triticum aestivum]
MALMTRRAATPALVPRKPQEDEYKPDQVDVPPCHNSFSCGLVAAVAGAVRVRFDWPAVCGRLQDLLEPILRRLNLPRIQMERLQSLYTQNDAFICLNFHKYC